MYMYLKQLLIYQNKNIPSLHLKGHQIQPQNSLHHTQIHQCLGINPKGRDDDILSGLFWAQALPLQRESCAFRSNTWQC